MKALRLYSLVVTLLLFAFACSSVTHNGGHHGGGGGGSKSEVVGSSLITGFGTLHLASSQTASNFDWSITPKAYAQSGGGPVLTGNVNGACYDNAPIPLFTNQAIILATLGSPTQQVCNSTTYQGDGQNAAETVKIGAVMIGGGTINNLVGVATRGYTGTSATDSGKFEVFIVRGSTLMATGITCTLGTTTRCSDTTHSFTINDSDQLMVTVSGVSGDILNGLQFYLNKQ